MADGFNKDDVIELMVKCHRRCCICHRFCGVKMEIDHIEQKADGGGNNIDNAIPVCFECHAEIHSYNDRHPRGRKFTPKEIKQHKEQWLEICKTRPEVFTEPLREYEVGPVAALIDELEFNYSIATNFQGQFSCPFEIEQFRKAIGAGAISLLVDEVKIPLLKAYEQMGKANQSIAMSLNPPKHIVFTARTLAQEEVKNGASVILEAKNKLTNFLKSED